MHLASLMPERTIVLLTGHALGHVEAACQLARSLEPAMVVMEDVDLVALERSHYQANPILFELLNAMEGLDEDADLIFALTTNRPELLEPALASRPGRIDLAVELPLPDADSRRRLFELYAQGLRLDVDDWTPLIESTENTSPAFIRELIRQAVLRAAERGAAEGEVNRADLLACVEDLKTGSGRLTASLLGAERPAEPEIADDEDEDDDAALIVEEDW
jgi:ATP-dependent 26S proteasome regulatory subunit